MFFPFLHTSYFYYYYYYYYYLLVLVWSLFLHWTLSSVWWVLWLGLGVAGKARGWVIGRAGLLGVLATWVRGWRLHFLGSTHDIRNLPPLFYSWSSAPKQPNHHSASLLDFCASSRSGGPGFNPRLLNWFFRHGTLLHFVSLHPGVLIDTGNIHCQEVTMWWASIPLRGE